MPSTLRSAMCSPDCKGASVAARHGTCSTQISFQEVRSMKANLFGAVIASMLLGWAGVSFAQTTSYGSGESQRCNTMSGAQKEQCLRDEANKTQGAPTDSASAGSSTPKSYGSGESARCNSMSGDEKEQCLR